MELTEEEAVALVATAAALLIGAIGELFDALERRREEETIDDVHRDTVTVTGEVVVVEPEEAEA